MQKRTDNLRTETKCQTVYGEPHDHFGAVSFPIYQTATFAHQGVGQSSGFDYTRMQNPTRQQLERMVASLENGSDAAAFSSGMAAIAAVMELFQPDDHIIVDEDLYGGSVRLFSSISKKNGLSFTEVDCSTSDIEPMITARTKAVFLETPTNPMMRVTDLQKLSAVTKKHGLLLIVDNTFLSPYFQNPLDLGADIVIHSGTKYLGGHNDTICGLVVTKDDALSERIRFVLKTTGAGLSPFDSWLALRGIRTLTVRMERAQDNALALALFLQTLPKVKRVIYPGLKEHPGYDVMRRQASGFGAMLSLETDAKETALKALERVRVIRFAESLGGTETLITYPITQTHADVDESALKRNGITDRLLRLSVGIEHVEDLKEDLKRAFA